MRVLVTGGTGFVGQRLVRRLIDEGHEVKALVRESSNTATLPEETELFEGELLDVSSLEKAVQNCEAVVHLAAYFDFYPSDVDLMYRVNVDGTKALMNASVGTSVERFIYCSSTEAIGPVRNPPANEDTELRPAFEYGASKVLAETVAKEISHDTGLPYIIIRPTGVLGEGDFYTAFETISAINNGEISVLPGDGEKHIMYTHVDDVVDGFVRALSSEEALNTTIILCPDEPMKYNELVKFIANELGVEPPKRHIPTALAKLGIGLMSPLKNRKKNTFLWHMKTVESMDQERWYSNERAKQLLDWKPKNSMQEGIKRAIDWYFKEGHLEKKH